MAEVKDAPEAPKQAAAAADNFPKPLEMLEDAANSLEEKAKFYSTGQYDWLVDFLDVKVTPPQLDMFGEAMQPNAPVVLDMFGEAVKTAPSAAAAVEIPNEILRDQAGANALETLRQGIESRYPGGGSGGIVVGSAIEVLQGKMQDLQEELKGKDDQSEYKVANDQLKAAQEALVKAQKAFTDLEEKYPNPNDPKIAEEYRAGLYNVLNEARMATTEFKIAEAQTDKVDAELNLNTGSSEQRPSKEDAQQRIDFHTAKKAQFATADKDPEMRMDAQAKNAVAYTKAVDDGREARDIMRVDSLEKYVEKHDR